MASEFMRPLKAAEKALEQVRRSILSARAVVTSHEGVVTELEGKKQDAILKSASSGRLPELSEINQRIAAARSQLAESQHVLATLERAENDSILALVAAEREAQSALKSAWDEEADRARAELVRVAGPLVRIYWNARYHGSRPCALNSLFRSFGEQLVQDLESEAMQATVTSELPESVESAMLTFAQRNQGTYHAAMGI